MRGEAQITQGLETLEQRDERLYVKMCSQSERPWLSLSQRLRMMKSGA